MTSTKTMGIRAKLTIAFLVISLLVAAFVVAAIVMQLETVELAAEIEAEHTAHQLALTGDKPAEARVSDLQANIDRLNQLYGRDVVVVDRQKKGIADSDKPEIGERYTHDSGNQVALTIQDGRARTFVEKNEHHPEGAMQIVVPLRERQQQRDSAIVGALIMEYTGIYDRMLEVQRPDLEALVAAGVLCIVIAGLFGVAVARHILRPIKALEKSVRSLAAGDYAATVDVSTSDEIGMLGSAFNQMARDLEISRGQLLEHQQLLEGRVKERTRELKNINALLQQEVRERMLSAERVEYLAYHDALTGLPNRALFSKLLDRSVTEARRYNRKLAVLFIDLDRFKHINDSMGHAAGDELLRQVSARLKDSLRTSDVVARLGGDEFVVLLPDIEDEKLVPAVAHKLLLEIAKPFNVGPQEFRITGSIGVATYPQDGHDERTLMKNADMAMYHAKEEGKNNFRFFSAELDAASFERIALESSLRRALELEQFELYYQPKVDLDTGTMTGVEALIRWHHPYLGLVSPVKFIPIAEASGLIVPIGKWVLRTACMQSRRWLDEGLPPLSMAVNLSARQFSDENLLTDITQILEETRMDPCRLELEITESMLMHNVDKAMEVLVALKKIGVKLAIDDFGTGYSSLSTLKKFPVDTIKVDRSFIRDLPGDADDRGITDAIIAMGKTLSLHVVAEGVETRAQADFLQNRACKEVQGFYFSKPVTAGRLSELLRAGELGADLEFALEHDKAIRDAGAGT